MFNQNDYIQVGTCVLCKHKVFSEKDGSDPDPRGELGIKNSVMTFQAEESNMIGNDVLACYACGQEREKYEKIIAIAKINWKRNELKCLR